MNKNKQAQGTVSPAPSTVHYPLVHAPFSATMQYFQVSVSSFEKPKTKTKKQCHKVDTI